MMNRLAMHAFRDVLRKRQSKYGKVIEWLESRIWSLREKEGKGVDRMVGIVGA